MSESQLLNRIIQGLPITYSPLKGSLAVLDNLDEDRLTKILLREEARLFLKSSKKPTAGPDCAPLEDITRKDFFGQDRSQEC